MMGQTNPDFHLTSFKDSFNIGPLKEKLDHGSTDDKSKIIGSYVAAKMGHV